MRIFGGPAFGGPVYFENLTAPSGTPVAYDPVADAMVLEFVPCANRGRIKCNWVAQSDGGLCRSCQMTRTHPDTALDETRLQWERAEGAKRWVLTGLQRAGWFSTDDDGPRPVFDLLAERTRNGAVTPTMGHENGLITIDVTEADSIELIARREEMGEPYRTMIGHFRHEIAHFLFERLSHDTQWHASFREIFGDETADYGAALRDYYARADDGSWRTAFISRYASAHPHEDWAESAAHALHISDMLDSAQALNLTWQTRGGWIDKALDLSIALNHLNRSMGLDDAYPFIVSPPAREKLQFALDAIVNVNQFGPRPSSGA